MLCGQIKIFRQRGQRMTNFEKIKNMNIEEMTNFFNANSSCDMCSNNHSVCSSEIRCVEGIKNYLESEAE